MGVLGHGAFRVDDNFFDLGATSLDLIGVHAKIVETFGPVLTAVDLFEHPNIKAVAAKIDGDGPREAAHVPAEERARGRAAALRRAQTLAGRVGVK